MILFALFLSLYVLSGSNVFFKLSNADFHGNKSEVLLDNTNQQQNIAASLDSDVRIKNKTVDFLDSQNRVKNNLETKENVTKQSNISVTDLDNTTKEKNDTDDSVGNASTVEENIGNSNHDSTQKYYDDSDAIGNATKHNDSTVIISNESDQNDSLNALQDQKINSVIFNHSSTQKDTLTNESKQKDELNNTTDLLKDKTKVNNISVNLSEDKKQDNSINYTIIENKSKDISDVSQDNETRIELNNQSTITESESSPKPDNILVVYRLTFEGLWTEDRFPKSYPKFRPPAQWSLIFGQTHSSDRHIFQVGSLATPALQSLAESADPRQLAGSLPDESVFDQFTTPALHNGNGTLVQDIVLYRNYSMVSLVCKIVPSPDWFVGVDSLSLLNDQQWIYNITIPLGPLDAGTDGGLTFTSPKWRLESPLPIQQHTAREPDHRAASFYYPDKDTLPDIARVTFTKIFEKNLDTTTVSKSAHNETTTQNIENNTNSPEIYDSGVDMNTTNTSDPDSSSSLLPPTLSLINDVTHNYHMGKQFYPKHSRPMIVFSTKKYQKKLNAPSNLTTSFISSNRTNAPKPSFFRW